MENVDKTIEEAITKFQIVMLHLNKEIVEIVKETGLSNLLSREQIDAMKDDIDIMKKVITEHSGMLQKIS